MKKFLLVFSILIFYKGWGQSNMIAINTSEPSQMTICGATKTFTITIYNPSPFILTNDSIRVQMPSGINYVSGSVAGASEITNFQTNTPVFYVSSIPTLTTLTITYSGVAGCDVMQYTASGGIIENYVRVDYTANNAQQYDIKTTPSYIVRQPNLTITNVTNQSYTGTVGGSFTRCITILNGGSGELSQLTLTDVHGAGIQVTTVNSGTWQNVGLTETVVLNGTDFVSVGDGDNLFESGESITVCENVAILNCAAVSSVFEAYWGCNGQNCQSSSATANIVFPNLIPALVFSPNGGNFYAPMNSCVSGASPQVLKIMNTGLGVAANVHLDIFQATGGGYNNNVGSNIDPASFTIQYGVAGAPASIIPTTTTITNQLNCMAASAVGRAYFTIPFINPGDTVYLKWNTYSCCYNACTSVGQSYINGWRYKGDFQNICGDPYFIPEDWGRVYSQVYTSLFNNSSPATLVTGQTGTFSFSFANYGNSYTAGPGAHWKFQFILPPCLNYSGNLNLISSNGVSAWVPTSVSVSGNVVTAIFSGNPPFSLSQSEIKFDLTADCSGCGGSSNGVININIFYTPDTTCNCEVGVSCQSSSPINVICSNTGCSEGMVFEYFDLKRTNYGLPDNEPGGGDGIADATGSLDFTKIKTNRAMFGDTVTASYIGRVTTSAAHPNFQYCYASSSMSLGNYLTFLDATLTIYRGGNSIAACTNFIPTVTNSGKDFFYDLSATTLASCLPLGFVYSSNDSVVFKPRYKVTFNSTGGPSVCNSTNEFYLADVANPTAGNKFQCNNFNGNISLVGYYFTSAGGDTYYVKSCNLFTITQNYYLSIGQCCSNYAGGNMFPYEYRNWSHIDTLASIIPVGYEFVSARFFDERTAGTYVTNRSPWIPLTPVNPNATNLVFPVEQYFQGYGGSVPLSDDGFYGMLEIQLRPTCKAVPIVAQGIVNNWTFEAIPSLTGPGSAARYISTVQDRIIYEAPKLHVQAALPSILAPNKTASWDISISNTSSADALNSWLGAVSSGISIIELYDLNNNLVINPTGTIYQIGTINGGAVRNFKITAIYTSCSQDSIIVYSGWNCTAGYPTSLAAYPCTPEKITLKLTPLSPALIVNVTGPPGSIDLCDTASYTVEGINIQLGTAYDVVLDVNLPLGVSIVSGSSQLSYPVINPFVSIPDPVFLGGTIWRWDISAINTIIQNNGLKGIVISDSNSVKIVFKVITNCNYTSGSVIAFNLHALSACGRPTGQEVTLSSQLGITGATPPYLTNVELHTTYISPCASNSTMRIVVHNRGPLAFGNTDSIITLLPYGVSYVAGTFNGIHNAPINATPNQFILNGITYLSWLLPSGVIAGDSTVFTFDYKGDPLKLSCGISQFEGLTTSSTNLVCTSIGQNCGVNIITGDTTLPVFSYQAYFLLSNVSATAIPNAASGETVSVNFDITNTGQAILSGTNSIIQFYYDADNDCRYSAPDVLLNQESLQINNSGITSTYTSTFNVLAGQACAIIAVVDTTVNPCVCSPSQVCIPTTYKDAGNDTSICSGTTIMLGNPPINGYTYSWSQPLGLNNTTIANPLLTASNTTSAPITTTYVLTTNRGCVNRDTVLVTVYPLPTVQLIAQSNVTCNGFNNGSAAVSVNGGTGLYSYTWNSNPLQNTATAANLAPGTYTCTVTDSMSCNATATAIITEPSAIQTSVALINVSCFGGTNGSATITASGGTVPYTYSWNTNPNQSTMLATNLGAGTYVCTVTDTNGCVLSHTAVIKEPVKLMPLISSFTNVSCFGGNNGSATVTVNGGTLPYTYSWNTNPVQTNAIASNLMAGTYICTVTDSNGCIAEDTVLISEPTLLTATISSHTNVSCFGGSNGSATVTGNGGTLPYSYSWNTNPVQTNSTAQNLGVGTYISTITDFLGCSAIDTIIITEPPQLTSSISSLVHVVCNSGNNGSAAALAIGGTSPYTYSWNSSPVQTGTTAMNLTAGTYSCTIADSLGCLTTVSTTITQPQPLITAISSATICIGQSTTFSPTTVGGTSPYTYSWSPAGPTVSPILTTTYSLIATDTNGCVSVASTATITVNPALIANASALPQSICIGANSTLVATATGGIGGPYSYSWNTGQTGNTLTVSPQVTTTYTVTVTDNCTVLAATKTITVVVNPLPVVTFTSDDQDGCAPKCINFTNTTPTSVSCLWTFESGITSNNCSAQYCYDQTGNYDVSLTVTDANGCVGSVNKPSYITIYPEPIADFSFTPESTTILEPLILFTDLSTDSHSWLWSFGDNTNSLSTLQNPSFSYIDTGTFAITLYITNQYGCADSTMKEIKIDPDFVVYIPNAFSPNNNNLNDVFKPVFTGTVQNYSFMIFDRWGEKLFETNTMSAGWNGYYRNKLCEQEVYIYKIQFIDGRKLNEHNYVGHVTLVR